METIHFVNIPDTLTKELLVKCVYDDYLPIKQAALKKVICDNLFSDEPLLDLWEVDWEKLKIGMPTLSEEVYKYILEYHSYQKGLSILDTILSKGTYYATYNRLCDLLKSQFINNDLRQSILKTIKKHTSENTENLISQLFLKRSDRPELGSIILHMLENTKDLAKLCQKISILDVTCKHNWNDEYLPKICNIILPHMDMISVLRIIELCEHNGRLDDVTENIVTQVLRLINNPNVSQSETHNAAEIAKLLPQQFGIKIFRLLVQKQNYESINDYINYICYDKNIYPEQELEFIFQNIGENIGEAEQGIINCIYLYATNNENITNFLLSLFNNQHFAPALARNYNQAISIVNEIKCVVDETYKKIEQLNKLNILPQPKETPQSTYQKLIETCYQLVEKIYIALKDNGEACAAIALNGSFMWYRYPKLWNSNDKKFKKSF